MLNSFLACFVMKRFPLHATLNVPHCAIIHKKIYKVVKSIAEKARNDSSLIVYLKSKPNPRISCLSTPQEWESKTQSDSQRDRGCFISLSLDFYQDCGPRCGPSAHPNHHSKNLSCEYVLLLEQASQVGKGK